MLAASPFLVVASYGEDAAVDAHVTNLRLVGHAAQGDDGPLLELERREGLELVDRPGQVADDEALACEPHLLVFWEPAHVPKAFGHHPAGGGRDVDPDPLAAEVLRRDEGRAAAAEGVEDGVIRVAAGVDDAF
jgi:hypothetical protein